MKEITVPPDITIPADKDAKEEVFSLERFVNHTILMEMPAEDSTQSKRIMAVGDAFEGQKTGGKVRLTDTVHEAVVKALALIRLVPRSKRRMMPFYVAIYDAENVTDDDKAKDAPSEPEGKPETPAPDPK